MRTSYSLLTDEQKEYVTNYQKLVDAEKTIAESEATGADKEAAEVVDYLIDAIPETVTIGDKAYLQIVRDEYELLNDTQKALVSNYLKLENAEKAIATMEQSAADRAAARVVSDQIAALSDPITLADKAAVEAARAAFKELSEAQQALVYNLAVLEQAEQDLVDLAKAEADKAAAKAVSDQIAALPETVTAETVAEVVAAREAYTLLTEEQKLLVTNYQKLLDAEKALADLEKSEADKQAALAVEGMIEAIPAEVTLDVKEAVAAARSAYNDLTDLQKTLVGNYQKLVDAEKVIADLENPVVPPAPQVVYGDIDGDGKVTAADALEVLKSVVGKTTLTDEQFTAADTDGNDKADAADALNILKKVVGKIDKFPVEG